MTDVCPATDITPPNAPPRPACTPTAHPVSLPTAQEWEDDALAMAKSHGHTKMAAQLKSATKGPLDRLRGAKVVFSFPPSVYAQLKQHVDVVRRIKGGEGVYGVHVEPRLAVEVAKDDAGKTERGEASEGSSSSSSPSKSSPNKVSWSGSERPWVYACVRATIAVQIAPESEEYQDNRICQEQASLLGARNRIEGLRHALREAEASAAIYDEDTSVEKNPYSGEEETPTSRIREGIDLLEHSADRLKMRIRNFDNRCQTDRDYLRRLELPGPEGQTYRDDRKELVDALLAEVTALEEEVSPLLEQLHKILENKRHVMLQENITHIEESLVKLKGKIRERPKEPGRDASSAEQDKYKAEDESVVANNTKVTEEIGRREKQMERLKAKLNDDLRTLEKPNPMPAFLMTLSARAFARMDSSAFVLWLNFQPETNGIVKAANKS